MNIRGLRQEVSQKLGMKYPRVTTHPYIPGISFRSSIFIEQQPPIVILVGGQENVYSLTFQLIELRLYQPNLKIVLLLHTYRSRHPMYRIDEYLGLIKELTDFLVYTDLEEYSIDTFIKNLETGIKISSFNSISGSIQLRTGMPQRQNL